MFREAREEGTAQLAPDCTRFLQDFTIWSREPALLAWWGQVRRQGSWISCVTDQPSIRQVTPGG